jgi:adenylosuccinate lyase
MKPATFAESLRLAAKNLNRAARRFEREMEDVHARLTTPAGTNADRLLRLARIRDALCQSLPLTTEKEEQERIIGAVADVDTLTENEQARSASRSRSR